MSGAGLNGHESAAAELFAADLAAGRVPGIGAICSRLHVGQRMASQVQEYLRSISLVPEPTEHERRMALLLERRTRVELEQLLAERLTEVRSRARDAGWLASPGAHLDHERIEGGGTAA